MKKRSKPGAGRPTPPPPTNIPIDYAKQALNDSNFSIGGMQGGGFGSPMDQNKIPNLEEQINLTNISGSNYSIDMDQSVVSGGEPVEDVDREDLVDTEIDVPEGSELVEQTIDVNEMNTTLPDGVPTSTPWQEAGYSADPAMAQQEALDWRANVEAKETDQGVIYYKHPKTGAVLVDSANLQNNPDIANEWWANENTKDAKVVGTSITSMKEDGLGTSNYGQTKFGEEGLIDQIAQQKQYRNEGVVKRQIMDDISTGGFGFSSPNVSRTPAELEQAKAVEAEKSSDVFEDMYGLTSFTNTDYTDMGKKGTKDVFDTQPTTPITTPVNRGGGNKSVAPVFPGTKKGNLWLGSGAKDSIGTFGITDTTVPGLVDFYKNKLDTKQKGISSLGSGRLPGLDESFGQMNTDFLGDMKDRWTLKDTKKPKVKKPKGNVFGTERDNFGGSGRLYDPTGFYGQS